MYTLNCILSNSFRTTCKQVVSSLNVGGSSLGSVLQRAVSSSAARLQETQTAASTSGTSTTTGTSPSTSGTSPSDTGQNNKEFSYYPPLPGQDSALKWAGKKFEELPIAHIKATYNNTHIQLTDCEGGFLVRTSCGTEGFKNVRKATPIAAQTAGISAAAKATVKGVTFVRVVVKGLGPGRLSAIKGLTMGGLEVVSITDNTPVPHNGCRPRKARRV